MAKKRPNKKKEQAPRKKRVTKTNKGRKSTKSQKRVSKKSRETEFVFTPLMRNAISILITVIFITFFYVFVIKPYAYRWMPCHGLKQYGVCMPYGYDTHGIDISRHQGVIDWVKLGLYREADTPIQFIFMKATEGSDFKDVTFDANFAKAKELGFMRGAYHFFSPRTSAKKQAEFFIKTVNLQSGDLPPVLDVEDIGQTSKKALQDSVAVWLTIIEDHYKVKPILYTSYRFRTKNLAIPYFDQYPFWIAHYYVGKLRYKGEWKFWQHNDSGKVPGIDHPVDLNVFNGGLEELKALSIP